MNRRQIVVVGLMLALVAANVGTGAALVMTTHKARSLFQEFELLKSEEDRLRGDWSAYRIEVTSLAGHSVIDGIARDELGMIEPEANLQYLRTVR